MIREGDKSMEKLKKLDAGTLELISALVDKLTDQK